MYKNGKIINVKIKTDNDWYKKLIPFIRIIEKHMDDRKLLNTRENINFIIDDIITGQDVGELNIGLTNNDRGVVIKKILGDTGFRILKG